MSAPKFPVHPNNPSVPIQDKKWAAASPSNKIPKTWPRNKHFRVAFLNGTANQKAKVIKYADEWVGIIGGIRFDWVGGIHGDVRIAFSDPKVADDPIQKMSFSQVGTDSLGATHLPETTHLNEIEDTEPNVENEYERIVVQHEFGHILGFQFAPNADGKDRGLNDWRETVKWDDEMKRIKPIIATSLKNSFGDGENSTNLPATVWAEDVGNPIIEDELNSDSVMVFDWKNKISVNDAMVIAARYPFPIRAITFGVQDAFDRSLVGFKEDDLVLYAISVDNYLYRNTRVIWKKTPTSPADSTWKGWKELARTPILNPKVTDKNPLAYEPVSFVALDFPDRLEFFVAAKRLPKDDNDKKDDFLRLFHNAQTKVDGKWNKDGWVTVKHVKEELKLYHTDNGSTKEDDPSNNKKKLILEPATILRAVEVDGGANVFFITEKKVLGTIFRKAGEPIVPTSYHPVSGGSDVIAITSARIGAPTITNPPRIVAVTRSNNKFDISISSPKQSTQSWTLTSEGTAHDPELQVVRLATGMAIDTQHILAIGEKGGLHQILNKDGWVSWNDGFGQMRADDKMFETSPNEPIVSISVGVVASNDKEDGYLKGFAVSKDGDLWTSRVDDEGNWDTWSKGIKDVKLPKDIKRVIAKRTRSGDLEVFLLHGSEGTGHILLSSITFDHQGISEDSLKYGARRVWWDPRRLEKLEARK